MMICFAMAVVVPGLLWLILGKGLGAASFSLLVSAFFIASGVHAGGLLLMDQAKQVPLRGVTPAIIMGMWCVPKSILLTVGLGLIVLVVYLLIALLFYVCKTPGIGAIFYAAVFPLSIVITGLTFTALVLGALLALAAMWEGATISGALIKALTVLRLRLVETVLFFIVISLLAGFVFSFVGGVLMTGFLPAVGLSASILGAAPTIFGSFASSPMGLDGGSVGAYLLAGGFGGALLFALTMTVVFQVWLMGINLVFLKGFEGLDGAATEAALQSGLAEARRKAAEMGSKAKLAAEHARTQASQAMEKARAPAAASSTVASAPSVSISDDQAESAALAATPDRHPGASRSSVRCPACSAEVVPEDRFCGACGHRLQN